ncbi:LamG-like jellyroll fold domain-containing protein [Candidatus Nitrosocaldus cavascurensis]|uniref:Uncharacterized protein n=1 Tax=Candidatus Nitrosocaldus cavascurensis TaxID=2058097 RepID=A0A2K5AQ81_9ARCH|nr:LamG-like jellyroll fold domain-containing protein [Candidatus Nitrosocaldus cavascurensis]SPC33785.1 protein of unknown function [Candidatus Nitrosocaldus cavascurensis]
MMNRYRGTAITLATILLFQVTGLLLLQNNNNYHAMAQSGGGSPYNYAPYFTATGSNFVSIPDKQELRLQQQFSVSAWFKTTMNNNSQVAIIVNKGGFGNGDGLDRPDMNYGIWLTGTNDQAPQGRVAGGFESSSGTNYFVYSSTTYNDGQWHYVVLTYDGSTLRLYVDGSLVSSLSTNGAVPDYNWDTPLTIGKTALTNVNGFYFIGDIDEVRVYNRALNAQEVSDAYNNGVFASDGLVALQSFTPPMANPTSVTTDEDTPIQITLTATDIDNDRLTFSIVTNPTNGSLSSMTRIDNSSVNITYTPNANYNGLDVFTFKVNDGISDSNIATVTITINPVNDAPIANAGQDQTVDEGTLVTLNGSSSYDPDGDTITYQWEQIQGPNVTLSDPTSPTPSFTAPSVNSDTVLRFRLTVSDGTSSSSSEVTVTIRDIVGGYRYAPYFTATGSNFVSIPDKQELRLTTNFTVSAWFKTTMNNNSQVAIIVNKGGFGNGDGLDRPDMNYGIWLTGTNDQAPQGRVAGGFESSSGTNYFVYSSTTYNDGQWHYVVLTYDGSTLRLYVDGSLVSSLSTNGAVPDYNWDTPLTIGKTALTNVNGFYFIGDIDEVRVYNRALNAQEVSDAYNNGVFASDGLVALQSFTPPMANPTSVTTDEDTPIQITLTATDIDNDRLTFSIVTNPTNGSLSSMTRIDNSSVNITYTPNANYNGLDVFTFKVNDGISDSNIATVTITINPVNDAPIANAGQDQTVDEGTLVTLNGSSSYDPDGDTITYQWEQIQGPNVTLSDPTSPTPSFTAPSVNSDTVLRFRLTVSDGTSSSSSEVTVTIRDIVGGYRYAPYFTATGSNFVSIPDKQELRLTTNFTVSAWFKTTMNNNSQVAIIVNKGGFGNGDGLDRPDMNYGIWLTGTNDQAPQGRVAGGFESSSGTNYFVYSSTTYNDGQWHYVVLTYDGSTLRLYVDGSLVSSLSTNGAVPDYNWDTPLTIGKTALTNVNGFYFIGDIDEVRVYNRALNAQEVSDAYNNGVFASDGLVIKAGFAPPIANAGQDQTVDEGTLVTLNGSSSYDPDGDTITYQWEQIQGPNVTLSDPTSPTPSFTAPFVDVITTLRFRLTVSDGIQSSQATVYVHVRNTSAYDYYPWFTLKGSDFFNVTDDPSLRLQQQFSVSAWFRTNSTFTNVAMIVNKGGFGSEDPGKNMNYGIWLTGTNDQAPQGRVAGGFESSSGKDYFVYSSTTYNDGQWHYVVLTYDGSTLRLYVDGSLVSSLSTNGAVPDNTGNQPLTIGKNSLDNSRYFIGEIDEVRVYNRASTEQEVNDAYNNGVFASDGLVIHLDMRHELLLSGATNIEDRFYFDLLNEINNAKRKIHVVVFWMEYKNSAGSNYRPNVILNAINDAKNRGVDVRLMYYYESEIVYPDLKPFLTNNGIQHKTVSTHAKIINIDDKFVYIGSGNINNNGLRNNHEIFVKSYNPNIIDRATKYLDRLWIGSGSRSFADDSYDNVMVSDGYFNSVLNAIQNAKNQIRIIMFVADGNYDMAGQLLTALNDAKNRGVDVKVIVDYDFDGNNDGIPDNRGIVSYLKSKGIPVKSDEGEPPRTHIKLVVVDDTTYIGSHNWQNIQLASTNEASVKLKSPFILQKVIEYFDWKWSRGRDL